MMKHVEEVVKQETPESGTCGFCGTGDGRLGDQGDERSRVLNYAVRRGKAPDFTYEEHMNSWGYRKGIKQFVTWCGGCDAGLEHMFQRLDMHNLNAKLSAFKTWLELDGIRYEARFADHDSPLAKLRDDPATHLDKLGIEEEIRSMQQEVFRRYDPENRERYGL